MLYYVYTNNICLVYHMRKKSAREKDVILLKISKSRLEVALARQCKSLYDLRGDLSPNTLAKIGKGEDLKTKTVGRLARALSVDPAELIEEVR